MGKLDNLGSFAIEPVFTGFCRKKGGKFAKLEAPRNWKNLFFNWVP
jgi:hypothetical protein